MPDKIFQTDWLASSPVFYNEKTSRASKNINDVIDWDDIRIHPEGFNNYLEFGYSVFGQTPLENIKFLPHSTRLTISDDGGMKIEKLPDAAEKFIDAETSEEEVLSLISKAVNDWERNVSGEIIIPTSGGLDSRLLNCLVKDKSKIRSFTYGTSANQSLSFETVNAGLLAERLGTKWQRIELENFFDYLGEWDKLFGPSVHAHGMYQMEFYDKIRRLTGNGSAVLSGIIGDAWAGSVNIGPIDSPADLKALGYSHGMNADASASLLESTNGLKEEYFKINAGKLKNEKWRVIEAMRFKITLLSYLFRVPEHYGFKPWSPFLECEIALKMLALPEASKKNRYWQRSYFDRTGVNFEKNIFKDRKNVLNLEMLRKSDLASIDKKVFAGLIKEEYVGWVNSTIANARKNLRRKNFFSWPLSLLYFLPKIHILIANSGIDPYTLKNEENWALCAYQTLKPLENVLFKRK